MVDGSPTDIAGFDPTRLGGGFRYDRERAERPENFFHDCLVHVKSSRFVKASTPFELQPWQRDITRSLFGWVDRDGNRRFRTVYIEIPRKNGKSTFCAGVALYTLYADGEDGAECYCAACDREQAGLLHGIASSMVTRNPSLSGVSRIIPSTKRITYKDSYFRALPADAHSSHGFNPHLIVADEVHAWKSRDLWDVLLTGTVSRAQPIVMAITTAGWDRLSLCWELHQYAEGVRDGKIDDPTFLPVLYGADLSDDWRDEKVWKRANPNYGVSVNPDYLRQECKRAQETPAYENTFRRLHLNQWTSQKTRWIQSERWRGCDATPIEFDTDECTYGGIDLSTTTDLTAWCIVQPTWPGYKLKWHFWIPKNRAREAERRDRVPYILWAEKGLVTLTAGDVVDYSVVEAHIERDCETYGVRSIGYDPWNAEGTRQRLESRGIDMVKVRQGYASLSEACKDLEASVLAGAINHGGNPVIEWMVENVEVETDVNGNIRPIKPKHGDYGKRIDGIIAAVIGIAVATAQPYRPEVLDHYDDHELELM
jgi:phage terminase large subunit-like protein